MNPGKNAEEKRTYGFRERPIFDIEKTKFVIFRKIANKQWSIFVSSTALCCATCRIVVILACLHMVMAASTDFSMQNV